MVTSLYNLAMTRKRFSSILEDALLEWRAQRTRKRESVSLSQFASYLGVSRSIVSMWLNNDREPTNESIDAILPALVELLGPQVYDDLGLASPDPTLAYVNKHWHRLPPQVQTQIQDIVEQYLERSDNALRPNQRESHDHA